jgi:hypothetical protein
MPKRLGWILGIVVVICLAAGAAVLVLLLRGLPLPAPVASDPAPTTIPETPSPSPAPTATLLPGLSPEIRASMDEIQSQVVTLRGLSPLAPVERLLLTPDELQERVLDEFLADYTRDEAARDAQMFSLLGLLNGDIDLWQLYADLLAEQVAGYYDNEMPAMFVVRGPGFAGPERLTYAHEYVHALQDQHYAIEEGLRYSNEDCDADADRCAAVSAMLEGDATLLQTQWLRTYAGEQDFADIQEFLASFQTPVFDTAPQLLQQDLLFPYIFGLSFVSELFIEGDWAAVDDAYARPPLSTEQILHPDRYPDDVPILLEVPDISDALGEDWEESGRRVLGEWYTRLTLESQLPSALVSEATEGWGGDILLTLRSIDAGEEALVLVTRWDTFSDAQAFFATFLQYGEARFGEGSATTTLAVWQGTGEYSRLERSSDQTLWILAPDEAAAEALREALPFPAPLQ